MNEHRNQFKKNSEGVGKSREYEQLLADNAKMQADLEYVAMMADVDLTEGEGGEEVQEQ